MPDTYSLSVINSLQGSNLMTNGMLDGVVLFTEDTQRYLFTRLTRKSAQAAGIQAMAKMAISEGDLNALERIAALAAQLVEGLDDLSSFTGHVSTTPFASSM